MRKVGIIAKTHLTYPTEVVVDLIKWLEKKKIEVFFDNETADAIGLESKQNRLNIISMVDLLIVLGGDGTLLSIARLVAGKSVPVMGVNMGNLGFLTEITRDEVYPVLEKVLGGDFKTDERLLLDVKVIQESKIIAEHKVLNDVVVNKGALARIVDLDVKINNQFVTSYRSADKRLTYDQIKAGVEAPTLSSKEAIEHENNVIPHDLAAISVGLVDGDVYTDLDYILDSNADVDMNVVMTADGKFVEVQGTGEEFTYTREELDALLEAATAGVKELNKMQENVLSGVE